jgi:hypothetical protein
MKPCGDLGLKWATYKGLAHGGLGLHFTVVPSLGLRWTKSTRGLSRGVHGGPGAREDEQGARLHANALTRVPNWTSSVTRARRG